MSNYTMNRTPSVGKGMSNMERVTDMKTMQAREEGPRGMDSRYTAAIDKPRIGAGDHQLNERMESRCYNPNKSMALGDIPKVQRNHPTLGTWTPIS